MTVSRTPSKIFFQWVLQCFSIYTRKKRVCIQALICAFVVFFLGNGLTSLSWSTPTVTSDNAYQKFTYNSRTRFGFTLEKSSTCDATRSYVYAPKTNTPISVSTGKLRFFVNTGTASTGLQRYIHAEIQVATGAPDKIQLSATSGTENSNQDALYTESTGGQGTLVELSVSDLCSHLSSCVWADDTPTMVTLLIGVTQNTTTFFNGNSTNGTSAIDFGTFDIDLARCATVSSSYSGGKDSYSLTAHPGDQDIFVTVGSDAPSVSAGFPFLGSVFFLRASSGAALTSPMDPSTAQVSQYFQATVPGTVLGGQFDINQGLVNDTTYDVQMSYVNSGGYLSPPGPPNGSSSSAPTATPSQVAGLLNKNACVMSTIAEEKEDGTGDGNNHFLSVSTNGLVSFYRQQLEGLRLGRGRLFDSGFLGQFLVRAYYRGSAYGTTWLRSSRGFLRLIQVTAFPSVLIGSFVFHLQQLNSFELVAHFIMLFFALVFLNFFLMRRIRKVLQLNLLQMSRVFFIFFLSFHGVKDVRGEAIEHRLTSQSAVQKNSRPSYTETLKHQIQEAQTRGTNSDIGSVPIERPEGQPYIEYLKTKSQPSVQKPESLDGYVQTLKSQNEKKDEPTKLLLRDSTHPTPYMEALKKGLVDTTPKKKSPIQSLSFHVSAKTDLQVDAGDAQANSYDSIYNSSTKYNLNVDISGERYLFRSPWLGAFGPVLHLGFFFNRGYGKFHNNGTFSDVRFRFMGFPSSVGLSYKFVQGRILVPFAQASLLGVPFIENRNDSKPNVYGLSLGYLLTLGVGLNIDWLSRSDSFQRYFDYGLTHTYLSFQYNHANTPWGQVAFRYDSFMGGFSVEY